MAGCTIKHIPLNEIEIGMEEDVEFVYYLMERGELTCKDCNRYESRTEQPDHKICDGFGANSQSRNKVERMRFEYEQM